MANIGPTLSKYTGAAELSALLESDKFGIVSVKTYGAKGDGVTDDTIAIQNAIDSLSSSGGVIYFPSGTYIVAKKLTVSSAASGITLLGADEYSVIVKSYVLEEMLLSNVTYMHIQNMSFYGNRVSPLYWTTGYIAIKPSGNLTMTNVNIRYFDCAIQWNGGYYHKYINCSFGYCNKLGTNYNGNNVTLFGCKVQYFNNGFEINGGTGDFVFQSGSIEAWSGSAIYQVSGSSCAITVKDTYVENYTNATTTGTGLNQFIAAYIVVASKGDVCFFNNNIQTKGIRRGVYCAGNDATYPININAQGNKWMVSNTSSSDIEYHYYASTYIGRIVIDDPDVIATESGHTGSYTPAFINSSALNNASGYNSLTKQALLQTWIQLTLLNGWTNTGSGNSSLRYYKDSIGQVHVLGVVTGTSSTDVTIATLPEGYRPEYYVWSPSSTTAGDERTVRILPNGDIRVETATPGSGNIIDVVFRQYQ